MSFEVDTISEEEAQIRKEAMEEIFEGKAPVQAAEDTDDVDLSDDAPETEDAPAEDTAQTEEPGDEDSGDISPADQTLAEINSRLSALDQLENRLKQTERRVGAMQNEFYNANKAAKEVANAPTKEEMAAAAESQEAWDELKEEFPSWAKAIDGRIAANRANTPDVGKLRESVESLSGRVVTNDTLERRLVGIIHPGFEKTIHTPEYKTWLASQPQDIQQKAATGETAEEAIDVLNRFKAFNAGKEPTTTVSAARKKRLAQAATSTKSTKTVRPPKSEEDMSEEELRQQIAKDIWGD